VNGLSPYKGLAPFDDSEVDVRLFFGRDRERELIAANLMASRLTVLYGESGVGKSSVLRAGVAHHLRGLARENLERHGEPELAVVVFDAWRDDPVGALGDAVAEAVGEALGRGPLRVLDGSLAERFEAWSEALAGELYVVLDQVEEYLLYHGGEGGTGTFAYEFPDALGHPDLRVNFLLSIREDAVAKLDVFKGRIPNVLGNYLRLEHLDRHAAREAIVGPLAEYNRLAEGDRPVEIEPELVEAVLDQVAVGRLELGGAGRGAVDGAADDDRVETPYLQLVMQRLWDEERGADSPRLRLQTFDRLGGAEEIVRDHVESALTALTPPEKDAAARMFDHLVTPSGTKIAHEAGDLAKYAGLQESDLLPILNRLGGERILRSAAGDGAGGTRYEIFHDVLAKSVLAWKADHESLRELERTREQAERRHRRLVWIVGVAAALLVVMAAVTVFALSQRNKARAQARRAQARELAATAVTQLSSDPQESLRLAVQAVRLAPTKEVEDALRSALLASHLRSILPGGSGPVNDAVFSRDGSLAVTADADGQARIFSTQTGALLHVLRHPGPVASAAFNPDGKLVVTADADGKARLWRVADDAIIGVLRHGGRVTTASFSHNGRLIVTSSRDHRARVWLTHSGRLLRAFTLPTAVRNAVLSPDGRLLLTVGGDSFARVFDVATGKLRQALDQKGVLTSASFSLGGKLIVTTGENRTARIWDASNGNVLHELTGHVGRVVHASFSPRGTLLVTAGTDGVGRVWSAARGGLVATLLGHTNYVLGGAFSPDGFWIVTASSDRTARVWNARSGDPRAVLAGDSDSVTEASFSPDGRTILTASTDGTARLWDSTIAPELSVLARFSGPLASASFSPDGRSALVAGPGRTTRIVNVSTGAVARTFKEQGRVTAAAFDPGGRLVATASGEHVALWQTRSGVRVLRQQGAVTSLAFAPDGRQVATGSSDRAVRVFALDGRLRRLLRGHEGPITQVTFGDDGERLATSSDDGTARIWNLRTGVAELVLRGHRDAVTSAHFSPDGTLVVTSSRDDDARIWNSKTGKLLHVLRGHFGPVSDADFSPDGRWIVTAGPATGGLWRTDTGQLVLFLRGHDQPLTAASFSPDGGRILTASRDGTTRIYTCDVCGGGDELLAVAKARLARFALKR
jgi:WD40 repeat protein